MAKQLNVNMSFTADTSQAKAQLQSLQNDLTKLMSSSRADLGITKNIDGAISKVAELKSHLESATNVDTGKLDFSKLSQSLKQNNTSLMDYGKTLQSLGPQGQQAFMSLTQAVMKAEVPLKRTSKLVSELGTSLMNTARWQLSSSVLHGFMGAVQSAYGYAQDLNKSLNDIRIVTGQSADQMARFAETANKSARELSATTTEYTNASLIYYQQGLSDEEVKARTDTTIKMAHAAGESATAVSSYMTAIWNNFDNGTKSLEYYGDVITELGAKTAASSEEIAEGLEKFASIGETVGLSYEYATSAVATIIDKTRQSPEVVGTALKTIFARLQGLSLGETLEDGVDLNKYSEGLKKVGVEVLDSAGNLKDANVILDDAHNAWENLSRAQQTALAQTVAGTRQYTQFMALMNNYDSFKENVDAAEGSEGTLQEQADIYAESWEAAQNRVQSALEGVYDSLINDEFFIKMLNSVEKVIGFVDHLIDNLGGVKGVLMALGAIVTKLFSNQLSQGLTNLVYNLKMATKTGRQAVQDEKAAFIEQAKETMANNAGSSELVHGTASKIYDDQLSRQQQILDNETKMNEMERKTVDNLMEQLRLKGDLAIESAKEVELAKKKQSDLADKMYEKAASKANKEGVSFNTKEVANQLTHLRESAKAADTLKVSLEKVAQSGEVTESSINDIYKVFTNLQSVTPDLINEKDLDQVQQLLIKLQNVDAESEDFETTLRSIQGLMGAINKGAQVSASEVIGVDLDEVEQYSQAIENTSAAQRNLSLANEEATRTNLEVEDTINNCKGAQATWADSLVSFANFAMSAGTALSMLGGAFDTLKDPDVSGWQKFLTILTTLGMIVPTMISMFGTFKKLLSSETIAKIANVAATVAQVAAEQKLNKEKGTSSKVTKENIKQTIKDTKEKVKGGLKNKGQSIKDTWNQNALAKNKNYTQTKSGSYAVKGHKGFVSADKAASMAGKEALGAMKSMAGGAALITAGVMVAVGAVKWGIAQYEKQAKAAKEAAEQANKAAEAYQHVAEAYNSFTSNMDNYKSAKEGLSELTKGTTEYREAVLKANEAAMELLENNENLSYTVDSDGLIQINEESLKMAQEEKLNQMENAQLSKQLAAQNAKAKQLESDKTDFARKELHSGSGIGAGVGNTLAATGSGAAAGALIGAGIGTIVPVIGNAVGAAVGSVVGGIAGLITGVVGSASSGASTNKEQEALNKLAQVYEKEGNARFATDESFKEMLKEQGITDPLLIQSLTENRESTMQLVKEMAENSAQINAMNEQMVASKMGEKIKGNFSGDNAEEMTAAVTEAMGANLDEKSAALYEEKYKDKAGGMKDKDIQAQYAEAMGWDVSKTENKSGNKATYYDKDGNVVAEDLSDEVARQFLAQQEALTQLETEMPFYIEAVNSLARAGDKLGEGVGTALASFAGGDGGNLNTLTQDQFAAVDAASLTTQKDEDGNIVSFTYNGEVIDDEKAKTLGYESAAAFYESFTAEIKRVENAWKDIELDFKDAGLDPAILDDLSLETAQKFQESLDKMNHGALGADGAKAYADGINNIIDTLNMGEADVASFISQLGDIDWSKWDAMDDVNALIESMGYELDLTTEQMQQFIETMRQVGGASPVDALQQTWDNAAKLNGELSKGVSPGSVLDAETYEAIIAENGELEDSFMKMIDGTYKYVGDKDLKMEDVFDLGEQLEETKENNELYEGAKEAAAKVDFAGLSKMEYVSSKDVQAAKDAQKAAQDAYDTAEEAHSDGLFGYKTKEEKADLATKQTAVDSAAQNVKNLQEQRGKDQEKAKAMVESIQNDEYLTKIAEKHGWTQESLQSMVDGIANGDDAAMEQMKTIATQMDKFMAAGDEGLYDIGAAEEKIASMATSVEELDQLTARYSLSQETYATAIKGLFASAAAEAQSLDELNNLMSKVEDSGAEVNYKIYADNLIRLGEAYENCGDEIEEFQIALQSGDQAVIEAAQNELEASIMLGEAAEQYGFSAEEMEIQAKQLAKAHNLDAKAAAKLAVENQRMNKGVEDLVNNWDDWKKELKGTDKTSRDWAKAAAECTKTIANLVGASEDLELPADFFDSAKNMELLDQAAQGSAKAIEELGLVVAAAQVEMLEFQEGMKNTAGNLIDQAQFDTWKNTILSGITELQNGLDGLGVGDDVYEKLGGDDWVTALNEMAVATQMSVEEMQALLNSMNVDAEVTTTDVPQKVKVPVYTTTEDVTTSEKDGVTTYTKVSKTVQTGTEEMDGVVSVAQINTGDEIGDKPKITYIGNGNVSTSAKNGGKSGGGGSKPKKAEKKKDTDTVERYKEIEDSLDDLRDTMEDVNKSTDRLYGASRIRQMDRVNDMLQEEIGLLKKKKEEAQAYLAIDRRALDAAASQAGVSLSYDENGNITNSTEALRRLNDQYNAKVDAANAHGGPSESEQEQLDDLDKKISELKDAISQYDETRESIEDIDNEIDDKFYEWQDNNAEKLSYKLEIEIELNDDELRKMDYYLSKTEDDFYKRSEAAGIMQDQIGVRMNSLESYSAQVAKLDAAYAAGEISQAAYIEGLDQVSDGLYSNLESINELDKQMMHYYGETLSAAREEIDKITDRLEHQTAILEHYQSVLDLMGKSTDYNKVGVILEGQAETTKNEMIAAREEFEMLDREKDEMYLKWKSATNEAQAELYKQQYEDALAASTEAQEEYLSKAEAYGESLRAILENSLNKYAQDLENALTGGTSFDQMSTAMERAASLQEEYLTTTNKIYETNKLMNQAQQQIDKSSNTVAKQRLKQFINETSHLQEKNRLSQFELDIQQAKYELLLAEIALEEAQDAKSQVRLQRDAEGNFGYVYTADQEKIAEAEQKLADAQNELYNIALEGANNYTEKYQQILNEMYDTLTDLQQQYLDGAFESEEEYQNAVLEAKQYYFEMLEQYSDLHSIALQTDSRVTQEAWSSDFTNMVNSTDVWKTAVSDYVGDVQRAFKSWESQMSELASEVGLGGDLSKLSSSVKSVTNESNALVNELTRPGGVLDSLQSEIDAVTQLTDEYAAQREAILKVAEAYEREAEAILAKKRAEAAREDVPNVADSAKPTGGGDKPSNTSGGDGKLTVGETVTYTGGTYYYDSDGTTPTGSRGPGKKVKVTRIVSGKKFPIHVQSSDSAYGWLKESQLSGFDTGGYTGEWGSYGKLAMLHEKELVLNADDTKNLLSSMELLSSIVQTIDLHTANSQISGLLNSPAFGKLDSGTLEQQVTIEANFPNVSSRTEIEEAFSTLVNRASQYANRK